MSTSPTGAAGSTGAAPPPQGPTSPAGPTGTPGPASPNVEFKDGQVLVDGKKMVRESDLIAAKQSLGTQLETQQAAHTQAVDAARLELSAEQQKVADLNAKVTELEARPTGAVSDEEIAGVKQQLTDALAKVETLTAEAGQALELRRKLLAIEYGVSVDSLADKDMKALDSFEEALKAVATSRGGGVGPYAVPGAPGGAAPKTPMDRAKEILAATPPLGTREAAVQK